MRAALLALLAALSLASAAAAGPLELVDDCTHGGTGGTGLAELEVACPGIGHALDELGAGPLLSERTRADLTRSTLKRVLALATPVPRAGTTLPARASLDRILPTLASDRTQQSWWERFKAWLRARLGGKEAARKRSWFEEWFDRWSPPDLAVKAVFYTLAALIICAAIAIVWNELRASGVLGPRLAAGRGRAPPPAAARRAAGRSLADVAAAPLQVRAAVLFDLLVRTLADAGRLGQVRDRTHRELRGAPPYPDGVDRGRFTRLAEIAEEQLFAATPVADARLSAALLDGEALLGASARPAPSGA